MDLHGGRGARGFGVVMGNRLQRQLGEISLSGTLALVILVVGIGIGYFIGDYRGSKALQELEKTHAIQQEELKALKETTAKTAQETQITLDKAERERQKLVDASTRDKADLAASLAQATELRKKLSAQMAANAAGMKSIQAELDKAIADRDHASAAGGGGNTTEADQKIRALKDELEELKRVNQAQQERATGLDCLKAQVPIEQLNILNRQAN